MASSASYLRFLLEQLSGAEGVSHRAMMGEHILYYRGKVVGGIYDDRLLVKPVPAALARLPEAVCERPYPGAKEMVLVERVDEPGFLETLFREMYPQLPAPKRK